MKNFIINKNTPNLEKIISLKLKKYKFCVVKKYIEKNKLSKIIKIIKQRNDSYKEIKISGDFYFKMNDFKRLDVGDSYKNSRFARFIFFPEWLKKNKSFYDLIDPIINLRNRLIKIKKQKFIYENLNNNKKKYFFCDLVRMIQYPSGGGFLSCHNDYDPFYPKKMINVLLALNSKKQKSYVTGGLYYILNKKKVMVDDVIDSGDLIFHNQFINHGVNSIDPHKNLNLKDLTGRITLNFSIGKFFLK